MKSVGFIGGGRITRIILQGLHCSQVKLDDLIICEPDQNAVKQLQAAGTQHHTVIGTEEEAGQQDWVFLAVHPPVMKTVFNELKSAVRPETVIISLLPVYTIAEISDALGGHENIVRMIPNAASIIGKGFNPLAAGRNLDNHTRSELIQFLKVLGYCPDVDEDKLEAYAILTAMGPTYLWPQFRALTELGCKFGLTKKETDISMQSMLAGAGDLWFQESLSYDQISDLIPVKPMENEVEQICEAFQTKLSGLHDKLRRKQQT